MKANRYFDVVYTTDEPRREVERWLKARCEGGWRLRPGGAGAGPGWRNYKIFFERESDIARLCRSSASAG